jgi:hypothetical protein
VMMDHVMMDHVMMDPGHSTWDRSFDWQSARARGKGCCTLR